MKRFLSLLSLWTGVATAGLLFAQPGIAQDLTLFQRYFGTMDYSVTGTGGIRGTGTLDSGHTGEYLTAGKISVSSTDLPPTADVVSAFLYWQTLEKTSLPSSARGYLSYSTDADSRVKILGKPLGTGSTAPCWSTGGSTGSSNGAPTVRVYRADILRYLKDPRTGQIDRNLTVRLRDSGSTGNSVPLTEGASLVLVYRHPALSFKSIVISDGSKTMDNKNDSMNLLIKGFDQASPGAAKLTHIVGNGQANFGEKLYFNETQIANNPFTHGWDNFTADVSNLVFQNAKPNSIVNTASTRVGHDPGAFDCLSWGAVVFSTTVQDTDEDGLLDVWETDGYKDLAGNVLVDLPHMGANPRKKDLFVEIDYMYDEVKDAGGNVVAYHSHLPKAEALKMVGDAFRDAPVPNPDHSTGINVVFDVGNNYQGSPYVLRTGFKGGDALNERWPAVYCTSYIPGPPEHCLFPNQPGAISWKKGFQHIKNNYFSDERNDIFHYVVFGHELAIKGPEADPPYSGRSVSGRADLPGNSVTVTLGRWRSSAADAQVGSANLQAATLLHELAHNLYGFHGGITLDLSDARPINITDAIVPRPNCNNKQSSLNYLYQSAGLLDAQGVFRVNLSGQVLTALPGSQDESGLKEGDGLGPGPDTPYRLRWYAPLANVQSRFQKRADGTAIPLAAARGYCDGSSTTPIVNSGMVRVDGSGVPGDPLARMPVDWNYNGIVETLSGFLDINFNGKADSTEDLRGFNDWQSIIALHGLQQVGSGRNLFGLSLGVVAAQLLQGEDDLGEDDLGVTQLGEDDLGQDQIGAPNLGEDDLGEDDLGEDDLGEDDLGQVADIDEPLAIAIGGNGPTGLNAVVATGPRRVILNWTPPAFGGGVDNYLIYRATGTGTYAEIGTSSTTSFTDGTVRNNTTYTYVVIAVFATAPPGNTTRLSNPSNSVTVTP